MYHRNSQELMIYPNNTITQKLYGRLTLKYFGKTWYTPCFLIPRFSVNKLSACTLCMMVTQLIYCPLRNLEVISQTCVFFKSILQMISKLSTSWEICLRWVPQNPIIDKSTLVQVMAWWCQATSHYMSQCWPRYIISGHKYGITRAQWVKHKLVFLKMNFDNPLVWCWGRIKCIHAHLFFFETM